MLSLTRMNLFGFKSFYQKTELTFGMGITAVVGPNGCGKSNISDAISWVLGEQSYKSLRGTRMEDVIFSGTQKRSPLPMAEVTLHLTWRGNGHLPPAGTDSTFQPRPEVMAAVREAEEEAGLASEPEAEATSEPGTERPPLFALPTTPGAAISVTRRLYRNGDSEYRINDRRCRLRDVQDLLAAASIGARTYAVIEQDRVHALLNARPRERREILEEAAGILGFKARRRAAELKLESSELNLARLRDLVLEIRRQANALKRQAARARRYRRTTDEIMRRRRILVHAALDDLRRQAARLAEDRATLSAEESGAAAALARVDATLEGFRAHLEDEGRAAGRSRDDLHAREREADRLQAAIATQQERAGEARDAAARQRREAGDLRSRAAAATAAAADGRQASSTAEAEAERQSTAVVALEARYTELLAAADEASRVAEGAQAELIEALGRVSEAGHRATRAREAGSRLAAQRRRLMAEREGAEIEDRDLATRVAESGARQAQAAAAADAARAACDGVATRRAEAAGRVEQARDRLSAAERDWEAARERRDALASLWRERVTGRAATGIGQALGEDVEVDAAWEGAAGAWLGDLLEARLVDSVEEALRVAASRRSAPGGELRLVVRELLGDAGGRRVARSAARRSGAASSAGARGRRPGAGRRSARRHRRLAPGSRSRSRDTRRRRGDRQRRHRDRVWRSRGRRTPGLQPATARGRNRAAGRGGGSPPAGGRDGCRARRGSRSRRPPCSRCSRRVKRPTGRCWRRGSGASAIGRKRRAWPGGWRSLPRRTWH